MSNVYANTGNEVLIEMYEQKWGEKVGDLPEGFFLKVFWAGPVPKLRLCCNKEGFRELREVGGAKPGLEDTRASLASWSLSRLSLRKKGREEEIITDIREIVERELRQLAAMEGEEERR